MAALRPVKIFVAFALLCTHVVKAGVIVETAGYTSFTRTESAEKFNVFQVEFKTSQSTGLLMHAKGAKDFVTLELIKGKLRYAADFGKTMDSYGEWTSGYHELYIGANFANSDWHTVILAHSEVSRRVYITIDKNRETEYVTSRTIPPISADFSIEYVHIGGMKGITQLSQQESVSRRGIKACFRNTTMNSKSLIDGKDVTLINAKKSKCISPLHSPIDFPAKGSYLSFNYTGTSLLLEFGLKTNVPNQFLISYNSEKDQLLTAKLDENSKIVVEIGGEKIFSKNVVGLHDSFWHEVKIAVSTFPNSVELTVDGQKSSLILNRQFLNYGKKILFGKGYVGCLKNLIVGTTKMVAKNIDLYTAANEKHIAASDLYDASNKLVPLLGRCSLQENCVPNPCMHGGKCEQKIGSFTCDCNNTGYEGSVCSKSLFSKSCEALKVKEKGKSTDGIKSIDVDGIGPLPKIQVYCDYDSSGTETKIATKLANDIAVENRFGSKYLKIPYIADKRSMKSIVSQSMQCKQNVKYVCSKSSLFQSPKGPSKVRWAGPDYYYHYYWGGSGGRAKNCRCGVHNNCTDTSKYCNCDARAASETKDEGYLENKKHLPMQEIEFLDVNSNEGSKGRFSIGPLICSGDSSKTNAVSFRDSQAFLVLKPTSVTDYNNAIEALTISFSFKTTLASGALVYASGRTSPDFIKIHIQSKSKLRAEINLGSSVSFVDVDITAIGRVFDDNKEHLLDFEFNRKEVMLAVDHAKKVVMLSPQSNTHLNLDGESFTLGGGYGITEGFIGCIHSFYLNGQLIDVAKQARFHEPYGVHAGCGIGCNRPSISSCNSGKCVEHYSSFTCDCSLSSYDGRYCHKESYPLHFAPKESLIYVFDKQTQIKEGHIMTAFKTDEKDGLVFSLRGDNQNCHVSLVLKNGQLKLLYNFDKTTSSFETMKISTASGKTTFSDGKLYSVRIIHNGKRISFKLLDGKSKVQEQDIKTDNTILSAVKLSIASIGMPLTPLQGMPNSFNGCISAFKYNYYANMATKPVSLNIFAMFYEGKGVKGNGKPGKCGKPLPTPPPLPVLLNRPTQSPDKALPIPGASSVFDDDMSVIIIAVACALALLLVIVIVLFCRHINRSLGAYKTHEDKRPLSTEHETTFMPPDCQDGRSSTEPDSSNKDDTKPGKKKEWYV